MARLRCTLEFDWYVADPHIYDEPTKVINQELSADPDAFFEGVYDRTYFLTAEEIES